MSGLRDWKRDVDHENRIVYFSGDIGRRGGSAYLARRFLYFRSVFEGDLSSPFLADLERCRATFAERVENLRLELRRRNGLVAAEFT